MNSLVISLTLAHAEPVTFQNSKIISEVVETFVRQHLKQTLPKQADRATMNLDLSRAMHLSTCQTMEAFFPTFLRIQSRITVGIRCSAPQSWVTYVSVNLRIPTEFYVAGRTILPEQPIAMDDLVLKKGDLTLLPPGALTDAQRIIGMVSSYRITVGSPIKMSALRQSKFITRGQNVRLIVNHSHFTISNEGKALENAPLGAWVKVRTSSGQIVSGVVKDANLVEVPLE